MANNPDFTFLSMSPSLDSQSQINLKCLPLHKITSPIAPIPSSIPIETVNPEQLTSSSPSAPDGIETIPELNYHPEYAMGCSVICRCALSMANPLGDHWGISPRPLQPANSLTISLRVKSSRTPAVTAPVWRGWKICCLRVKVWLVLLAVNRTIFFVR